jgi:hypothetical protein
MTASSSSAAPAAFAEEEAPWGGELKLVLSDASHLFVAPPPNPLAPGAAEALGIAGVDHLLGQLHLDKQKQRARTLVLLLPPEKVPETSPEQQALALHRQARWRLQEQERLLRNAYRYGWRVAGMALLLLAICLGISSVFASEITANMRPLIRKTFEYGFEIVGWVIMWHPIDVLGFVPLEIRSRIKALKTLAALDIVVRPNASPQLPA